MNLEINTKDYIVSNSEMVSTLGPFRRMITKIFRIKERMGSIYTVTLTLKEMPEDFKFLWINGVVDTYHTVWDVITWDIRKKTVKIQNTKPIFGLNKKVMHTLSLIPFD